MGKVLKETYTSWGQGLVTSTEPDVTPEAYSAGLNVQLTSIGGGRAVVARRFGSGTLNPTPLTGASAIVGIHQFRRRSGSTFTNYNLLTSDNGRLDTLNLTAGTTAVVSASAFTSSSTQEYTPSWTDANNLAFVVNGVQQKKYDGSTLMAFGIAAPLTAPTIVDAADSGNHNGTYEARVTFYNSATGQESSAGPTSSPAVITSSSINWSSIPTTADAQVDKVRLYLRNTGTMSNFYFVAMINEGTTTANTNISDTALTEIGPDTEENNPPPTDARFVAFHGSRLFVATATDVHYSKLDMIESFDPESFETPAPENSQVISGIVDFNNLLVIFKSNSTIVLDGIDPDVWILRTVSDTIGCVSHRSICAADGRLYWWSEQGPVVWNGGLSSIPELIAQPFISRSISHDELSFEQVPLSKITGARDTPGERVLWSVPQLQQSRNTTILPFNYRINRWESNGWDPFDASTLATIDDDNGEAFVMLGGYAGQAFRMGSATSDGIRAGTTASGTFVASAATMTTFTDAAATFDTTGGGLVERKVTIVDADGMRPVDELRQRIASNTATTFTLNTGVGSLIVGDTYTYYIGGPAMDWQSAWLPQADAFFKKRYMFVYYHFRAPDIVDSILLNTYFSYLLDDSQTVSTTVSIASDFALWDEVDWDDFDWGGLNDTAEVQDRFRIGRTGTAILLRIRHYAPDADLTLVKMGVVSEELSERLG